MKYDVHVHREGSWWMVRIPAIDGLTQARRLEDTAAEALDFIVLDQDVRPSTVEVTVTSIVIDSHEFADAIDDVAASRAAARAADAEARAKTRTLARELAEAKIPVRDIGQALSISYQRAHQLVSE